jgi:hypothetical protein
MTSTHPTGSAPAFCRWMSKRSGSSKTAGSRFAEPSSRSTFAWACLTDLQHYTGSWPVLVKRGGLEVLHRFSVQRTGGKTASFLREELSISLSEVPALSTSPNMAKSRMALS